MGIKNFHPFLKKELKKKDIDLYKIIPLKNTGVTRVAVDTCLFLYKFKASYGNMWLQGFVNLIETLNKNKVESVFVFDGNQLPLKSEEKKKRRATRDKLEQTIKQLEKELVVYDKTGVLEGKLKILNDKKKKDAPTLLRNRADKIDRSVLVDIIERKKGQVIYVLPGDTVKLKRLLHLYDVSYIVSRYEGETLCAVMCNEKRVDAVLTEDTDVLCYGCPVTLCKFSERTGSCVKLVHSQILKALDMTSSQFRDFCIMCGTDYNTNIPRVGNVKSYKYIMKHGNIDSIAENEKIDISCLNHEDCRRVFNINAYSSARVDFSFSDPKTREMRRNDLLSFKFQENLH